jgi:hypothetical protein
VQPDDEQQVRARKKTNRASGSDPSGVERVVILAFNAGEFSPRDLSAKYDRFAPWYDFVEGLRVLLGLSHLRRAPQRLRNLGCRSQQEMLELARARATKLKHLLSAA